MKKITACHLGDCTTFLQINGDPTKVVGAGKQDAVKAVETIHINLTDVQQIVGLYGYKVR